MSELEQNTQEKTLIVDKRNQAIIDQALDKAFDGDPADMLATVEEMLGDLEKKPAAQTDMPLKLALESTWYFASALNGVITGGLGQPESVEMLGNAASGFEELGLTHLRDLSVGMAAYYQAMVDLKQMNITQAIDRLRAVEDYLKKAGRFSWKYKMLIDHMKPDMLVVSALPALQQLDFETASTLLEEASKSALHIANTYYSEDEAGKGIFQGLAHLYLAFYKYYRSYSDLQQFDYDRLVHQPGLVDDAQQAREQLCRVKNVSEPIRVAAYQAEAIALLQEVIQDLARFLKNVFESPITPKLVMLREMRDKVRQASESAARSGPAGIVLMRSSERIANQIKNLERLTRPTKKDFGVYSGLVAVGIFTFLLLAVSWVNASFGLGLGAGKIISSCISLGLIAGFGLGAVKFKGLLFPQQQADGNPS